MAKVEENNSKKKVRDFVIGDPECPISVVVIQMMSSSERHKLVRRWPELAARLRTDWAEVWRFRMCFILELYLLVDILVNILTKFRSTYATKATLGSVIIVLNEMKLKAIASELESYFNNPTRNSFDNNIPHNNSEASLGGNSDGFQAANKDEIRRLLEEFNHHPHKGLRCSRRSCVITFLFVTAFSLVLASTGFLIWYVVVKLTVTTGTETFAGSLEKPVIMSLPIKTDIKIEATSYDEYIKILDSLEINNVKSISLNISLNYHLDWKKDLVLIGKDLVNILIVGGDIDINVLLSLLDQAKNISELHILNSGDRLCHHVRNQSLNKNMRSTKYELPKLEKIVLTDVTSCTEIFNIIANSIQITSLAEFRISDGVLDDTNILHIQVLLQKVHNTIKAIEIGATKLTDKYFYPPNTTFSYVTRLKLNLVYSHNKNITPFNSFAVDSNFIETFGRLDYFKNKANMSYAEFLTLLGHSHLKKLDVKVLVYRNVYNKDMASVYLGRNLENVKIHLFFYNVHCPTKLELKLLGIYKLQERVKDICFWSNCGIDFRKNQASNPKSSVDILQHMCTHS